MAKKLLYKLFGVGKLSQTLRSNLEKQSIILEDEGIGGSITFINYQAPGKRFGWSRRYFTGSLVLTKQYFYGLKGSSTLIALPLDNKDILSKVEISLDEKNRLFLKTDAAVFNPATSGTLEFRYSSDMTNEFLEYLQRYKR